MIPLWIWGVGLGLLWLSGGAKKGVPPVPALKFAYKGFVIHVREGDDRWQFLVERGKKVIATGKGLPNAEAALEAGQMAADDYAPGDQGEESSTIGEGMLAPLWPAPTIPIKWNEDSFGSPRPWDAKKPTKSHMGVDIKVEKGEPVIAPEAGVIIKTQGWRGPNTRGVLFQPDVGPMLVFGAVAPGSFPPKGTRLERGQQIAIVGEYPDGSEMLHFEVWEHGTQKRGEWFINQPPPPALINPSKYLAATVTQ